ncbi:hypothetical protein [Candidatus Albibeggiatoa sp. nov. NOAA]|uniref:hypothetical protein n=1 Tax=Candidatus Albibeggiatoa sp. nov. NOAA TaxID=3162724 RepID=UPI0032F52EB9|nr:hypothetical protein [Thiotrichaceae bacterium]
MATLSKLEQFYINSFTNTFLAKPQRVRWREILLKKPPTEWSEISAWDLGDKDYCIEKYCKEWDSSLHNLLNTSFMQPYKNTIALVIYIGHDQGRIEYRMLREILAKEFFILEGIVIIEPLSLALALNHDGGICLCRKES